MVRFFGLLVVALVASPATADIPPPPPEAGFKRVPYEFLLKLETELPGYKFYTFRRLGLGGKESIGDELRLGTESGTAVPSSSSPSVRTGILAVPETIGAGLKAEDLAALLSRESRDKLPAGVVVFETRGTSRDLKASDPRSRVENVVTISPDETAGVKFTAKETPAPPGVAVGSAPLTPLAMAFVGVAVALAIVTLGVWYFRRK